MRILITGANGMLAKSVIDKFSDHDLILTDVNELDITNEKEVIGFVKRVKPDCIINCAAFTAVDNAETAGEIVEKVNAIGPLNLAKASKEVDATLVHVSTDYVFGGDLDISKEYSEDDPKAPVTAYGITKLHGEENIQKTTDKYYIFRTAWLYGEGKNFVRTMLRVGKAKEELSEEISVVNDQHGSPTYTEDLANYIYEGVTNKIPYGVYNATDDGYTTWYHFTQKIFELAQINCVVNPVTTEEYIKMMGVVQAKRPKNSKLSKEKLQSCGIYVPHWEDSLKEYLKKEKELSIKTKALK